MTQINIEMFFKKKINDVVNFIPLKYCAFYITA